MTCFNSNVKYDCIYKAKILYLHIAGLKDLHSWKSLKVLD